MAKRVSLTEFKKLFTVKVEYSRREVKELATRKGYQVPSNFWEKCILSKARFGITERVATPKEVNDEEFVVKVDTKRSTVCQYIEVEYKPTGHKAYTSIGLDTDPQDAVYKLKYRLTPVQLSADNEQ